MARKYKVKKIKGIRVVEDFSKRRRAAKDRLPLGRPAVIRSGKDRKLDRSRIKKETARQAREYNEER